VGDLSKGTTFASGTWTAADLNNLVDNAVILPAAISGKAAAGVASADSFLFLQASSGNLKKCALSDIIAGFPSDAAAATAALRTLGTGATQAAAGNDGRFSSTLAGSVGKLRKIGTAGLPGNDVAAGAGDLAFASVNINGGTAIDWATADVFYDTLTGAAGKTYTFSNVADGRSIIVILDLTTYSGAITWPSLFGAVPAQTNGSKNMFTFVKSGISGNPSGIVKAY
jgi:hypothetical protein